MVTEGHSRFIAASLGEPMTKTARLFAWMLWRSALVLLLVPGGLRAVDPRLLEMAADDVNFVMGVRLADVASSPLVRSALEEAGKQGGDFMRLISSGERPLEGVEEALVLANVETGTNSSSDDALMLLRGDFTSPDRLITMLCHKGGCNDGAYGGAALHETTVDGKEASAVILDDHYAALGTPAQIRALIDRRAAGQRSHIAPSMLAWLERLSAHHVWIAAKGPFEAPKANGSATGPSLAALETIDGLGFGLTIADDVLLGLELRSMNEEAAENLYDAAKGFLALAAMQQEQQSDSGESPTMALFQNLNLSREAKTLRAELRVPQAELMKRFNAETNSADSTLAAASLAVAQTSEPARPARPREGVIRIYGLGQNAVEVEATRKPGFED